MTMTLLQRARTNRLSAIGVLPPPRHDNVFHLADLRKPHPGDAPLLFRTTRRSDRDTCKGRLFRVA